MSSSPPGSSGLVTLVGRVLIALLFIPSGIAKLTGFAGATAYVAAAGLPAPALGAAVAIVVEVGFGLALLAGWQARRAALVMALFTLAAAFCFHQFWAAPPDQKFIQNIQFFKNMAIAGGLLFVFAFGPGAYSLDARSRKA
jgi:putative oxidoreductase